MKDFSLGAVQHLELVHQISPEDYLGWFLATAREQLLQSDARLFFSF